MTPDFLLDRLIFASGPPRSGTTLLAKLLNSHSNVVAAVDNIVYERWCLYYYRNRTGIVHDIRSKTIDTEEIRKRLLGDLVRKNQIWGIAPSQKVSQYPLVPPAKRPDEKPTNIQNEPGLSYDLLSLLRRIVRKNPRPKNLVHDRYRIPFSKFETDWQICLKSPELVFVLPQLAQAFPGASFVLVFRPAIEIAESMFRRGTEWQDSYHRRWRMEVDNKGRMIPPPGVPQIWHGLWAEVTDFQRCIVYACSYLNAMAEGVYQLPHERRFIYNHTLLQEKPEQVLTEMGHFLGIAGSAFDKDQVRKSHLTISAELQYEYQAILPELVTIRNFDSVDELFITIG